ncbi:MAG: hypothetical protein QOH12_5 [Solirubrobacteraceae bacterium]|nr:hypothetical protein [Solirubrobacteraceae bacterium]
MPIIGSVAVLLGPSGCGGSQSAPQGTGRSIPNRPLTALRVPSTQPAAGPPAAAGPRPGPPGPLAIAIPQPGIHSGTCMVWVITRDADEFSGISGRGVSCKTAIHVVVLFAARLERLLRAGRFCDPTLCTETPPTVAGFVCRGNQLGDSYWSVECRRGRERVYTSAAA